MYVTKDILNWRICEDSIISYDDDDDSPYEGWSHAEKIISSFSDRFHLIDVVSTLKRVIDYRVKDLSNKYNLKGISSEFKKINNYERLAHLGIIRPIMLQKLLEVINNVEHKHEQPPSLKVCKELVEFVWYFLKSTDKYAYKVIESYCLEEGEIFKSKYGLVIQPDFDKNWHLKIYGW